ncbi:10567_t:CDS:2, partial [Funneliformis geosporum]
MSFNVASFLISVTSNLSKVKQVKNRARLDLKDENISKIYIQKVKSSTFLDFTVVDFEKWRILGSLAKEIEKLINEIKG